MGNDRFAYRPELDGLRAIAVTSVLLCHLGVPGFSGGYVGVDIFFVLSGFLISRLIADDLRVGRFSLADFYERRIRRIVPALVVVLACVSFAALLLLMPDELKQYGRTLTAAALSISNVWFWLHTSYFAPGAATQPLLHTWSLGIEEQFYVIFPLLLAGLYKFSRRAVPAVIWILLLVSLGLSALFLSVGPKATFYLLHSRAWELLVGTVLALGLVPAPRNERQKEFAGFAGLAAIAVAIVFYTDKMPFPGPAALLPCVGAGLIIWAGAGHTVERLLSARGPVFIGLISYSLYLWHWPLIVFAKLLLSRAITPLDQISLAAVSIALAFLTWRFVETPFRRRGTASTSQWGTFAAGGVGIGALVACGAFVALTKGLPGRFSPDVLALAAAAKDSSPLRRKCHFDGSARGDYDNSCVLGADVPPTIVVYGDSHGAELSVALASLAEARGTSVRQLTASGCPPATGFNYPNRPQCSVYNAHMMEDLLAAPPGTTIIIAANSFGWANGETPGFMAGLKDVVERLSAAGQRLVVLGPVPPHPNEVPVPGALARRALFGETPETYTFQPDMGKMLLLEAGLKGIAADAGARYVTLLPFLCPGGLCRADIDGAVLYFDDNHLTVSGAKLVATRVLASVLWPTATATKISDTTRRE
ncbi:acyltransferase [Hyphomicrobium methylovorum]|uniref:SGNH hydrolase domain-containing protein n=1 Tax=Hyphomicrobium methylovorum TaxID=84 RepID=UPI0015E77786|nr:acyltransferase [Hyphomicrobium methylovorum]